jgi:hypothetical protein
MHRGLLNCNNVHKTQKKENSTVGGLAIYWSYTLQLKDFLRQRYQDGTIVNNLPSSIKDRYG